MKQLLGLNGKEKWTGQFCCSEGVKLGKHKGAPYYTIGQRKGLESLQEKPAYVLKINPAEKYGDACCGNADQLETEYMLANEKDKMVDERELFGCENRRYGFVVH